MRGIFLQQLLLARELSLESDVIFKLHTKKRKAWRDLMIEPLCGSVQAAASFRPSETETRSPARFPGGCVEWLRAESWARMGIWSKSSRGG